MLHYIYKKDLSDVIARKTPITSFLLFIHTLVHNCDDIQGFIQDFLFVGENQSLVTQCVEYTVSRAVRGHAPLGNF